MDNHLTTPILAILHAAEVLVLETDLNDIQLGYLQAASDAAKKLMEMIISFPTLETERARELFSYETRSHLASILGYAEILLDGDDGELDEFQREQVKAIRAASKNMVKVLAKMLN